MSPSSILSDVVLPAPFGPEEAEHLAAADRERQIGDRDVVAELLAQRAGLDDAIRHPATLLQRLRHREQLVRRESGRAARRPSPRSTRARRSRPVGAGRSDSAGLDRERRCRPARRPGGTTPPSAAPARPACCASRCSARSDRLRRGRGRGCRRPISASDARSTPAGNDTSGLRACTRPICARRSS